MITALANLNEFLAELFRTAFLITILSGLGYGIYWVVLLMRGGTK